MKDYYGKGTYEAIKVIQAHHLDFNYGNIVKYAIRAGKKTGESRTKDTLKILQYAVFAICDDVITNGSSGIDIVGTMHASLNDAIEKFFQTPPPDTAPDTAQARQPADRDDNGEPHHFKVVVS